jgi:hypothetical protein
VPIEYRCRPPGSSLEARHGERDGLLIFKCILLLFKDYKPFVFFTAVTGLLFALLAGRRKRAGDRLLTASPSCSTCPARSWPRRSPSLAAMSFAVGIILDTISRLPPGDDRAMEGGRCAASDVDRCFEAPRAVRRDRSRRALQPASC